jgi:hypothetical protein
LQGLSESIANANIPSHPYRFAESWGSFASSGNSQSNDILDTYPIISKLPTRDLKGLGPDELHRRGIGPCDSVPKQ